MSRTLRSEPSNPCWMRRPKGKRRVLSQYDDDDGVTCKPNRRAIPLDAWDDAIVSTIRGQKWSRDQ